MEITLDTALVNAVVADEYEQTRRDVQALGVLPALARSQARHDARLAAAPDATTLACRAGCFWCCYFSVDVRPVELLRILGFMDETFSSEARERVRQAAESNRAMLAGANELARMQANVKCPFLQEGRCSIYPVRPQTCRNYHATSAAGCQRSFEDPKNLDIDPEFAPFVYQTGGAHVDGFSLALRDAGLDVAVYELNAALCAASENRAEFERRLASGSAAFESIAGAEAPFEFAETDP